MDIFAHTHVPAYVHIHVCTHTHIHAHLRAHRCPKDWNKYEIADYIKVPRHTFPT